MTPKKTSTPIDPEFQKFWDAYGLKRDRVAAERAWRKLSKGDRRAALDGIRRYRDDCEARNISRMYAQGYLNHRRWEDESDVQTDLPLIPLADRSALPIGSSKNEAQESSGADTAPPSGMEIW